MKSLFFVFFVLSILSTSCNKEKTRTKPAADFASDSIGFSAKVIINSSVNKNWKSTSSNSNQAKAVGGIDYFANRGGISPDELTLMSFGKFTDDTSSNTGRLTIFLKSITDTGMFNIDGINSNYAVLSLLDGNNLEHYSSDINNQGYVNITKYDIINKIISGNFKFKLMSNGRIISVDNGIFTDIPFKQ